MNCNLGNHWKSVCLMYVRSLARLRCLSERKLKRSSSPTTSWSSDCSFRWANFIEICGVSRCFFYLQGNNNRCLAVEESLVTKITCEKWEECICKIGVNNILYFEDRIMKRFLSTVHVPVKTHTIQLTSPLPYTGRWMTGTVEEGTTFTQTHTMNWTGTKTKSLQPLLLALCP